MNLIADGLKVQAATVAAGEQRERRERERDSAIGALPITNAYERALMACQSARENVLASARGTRPMLAAIDAYTLASIALWRAAEAVCDAENLPADGEGHGIEWRVPMVPEDTAEQATARLADDAFCRCGARGYLGLCPACQREANAAGR
ncbi:MAG: hypothetical protein WC655_24845 [Candidatus Hydrogenedentales bacterium]|jgi:hypothetical protein